jgi:hypothetical protein
VKKLLGAASAVALILSSASAFAQAPAPEAAPAPGVAPGAMSPNPPALSGQGDAAVDVGTIVTALGDSQAEIGKLSALPPDATIQVVDLGTYLEGADAATLNPALSAAEGQADAARQALQGNSAIQAQLAAQNVDINSVVGFGVDGSTILVFTHGGADAGGAVGVPAQGDNAAAPAGGAAPAAAPAP